MKINILFPGVFLLAQASILLAAQLVPEDQIVTMSSCIGADCVEGEVFDFDTVKLKTNDPLIKFQDTSNSSSFPSYDWSMGITDNATTGAADFFINDVTGGNTVLHLEAGTNGGVALGAGSTVEPDAVSVGATGTERRIVNVADGVADTDAATVGQFSAFTTTVIADDKTVLDTELTNLQSNVDSLSTRLDAIITRLNGG